MIKRLETQSGQFVRDTSACKLRRLAQIAKISVATSRTRKEASIIPPEVPLKPFRATIRLKRTTVPTKSRITRDEPGTSHFAFCIRYFLFL
jgi:hypothetical protein